MANGSSFKFDNAAKVVIEAPTSAAKSAVQNSGYFTGNVELTAEEATQLDITVSGPMTFVPATSAATADSVALGNVETLNLTLENMDVKGAADGFQGKITHTITI